MEDMPIYISHMVSAMEAVELLLWNTSNVTHITEHLILYTELSWRLVPSLQVMPDILFTDEAQFTQDGNANTRNSYFLPHEDLQLVTQCHFQHRFSVKAVATLEPGLTQHNSLDRL